MKQIDIRDHSTFDKIDWNPPEPRCPVCGSCLDDGFCDTCNRRIEQ